MKTKIANTVSRWLALTVMIPATTVALVGQKAATPRSLRRDVRTARQHYPRKCDLDFVEDARMDREMYRL